MTLALPVSGTYARVLRAGLGETLTQDWVTMARAMGVRERRVLVLALRQASLALLTTVGLTTGTLLGGAALIETLFSVPGLGRLLVEAVLTKDYLVVQGVVLTIATVFVLVNAAADVATIVADPRQRIESHRAR